MIKYVSLGLMGKIHYSFLQVSKMSTIKISNLIRLVWTFDKLPCNCIFTVVLTANLNNMFPANEILKLPL